MGFPTQVTPIGSSDPEPPGIRAYSSTNSPSSERSQVSVDGGGAWVNTVPAASIANGRTGWRSGICGSTNKKQVALITATVIVDALAPLMQERATRRRGFDGSSMVLAETMSYFLGGITLAVASGGIAGFWRCVRPARYLAFLPASAAFSTSNFLTYVAVRGLGASQFYLLAQLRVAVLAVFLRIWTGARQPSLAWLALVQLAVGMVVLVHFKANVAATDCALGSSGGVAQELAASSALIAGNATAALPMLRGDSATRGLAVAAKVAKAAASRAEFAGAVLALCGVVFSSAFAFIYMEWQLKSHAQDPLFVQLHQMNSFGAVVSLVIFLGHQTHHSSPGPPGQQAQTAMLAAGVGAAAGHRHSDLNSSSLAANASGLALRTLAVTTGTASPSMLSPQEASPIPQFLMLITVVISRGVLSGSVLKNLDSIAKGLIDVTAIVVCTGIQFVVDPDSANGTVIGIQALMLLSILSYIVARAGAPPSSVVPQKPSVELSYVASASGPATKAK